jgi:hypothetical protein
MALTLEYRFLEFELPKSVNLLTYNIGGEFLMIHKDLVELGDIGMQITIFPWIHPDICEF